MNDALFPECSDCGRRDGIHEAKVIFDAVENQYKVFEYRLACGHTEEEPDAVMEREVVQLLQIQHPDLIEVVKG